MANAGESDFLIQAATYLGAAAVAVPVFNRLKLGSILGYITAGVAVGPHGLDLLHQEEGVFHIAELGVVLFLFLVGLELSLSRLWTLRRDIFGFGAAQMAVTGVVIAAVFVMAQVTAASAAVIAGLSFAFSSTAFALQFMKDRGELNTAYGRRAFPVLLFQDLAVIPLLAALPFVAGAATAADGGGGWAAAARAALVLGLLVLVGRFALDPVFRLVARSASREAFAATALFVVAAVALAVGWAGLSMALGAFLAGALLAESAYRHQIETDLEPFRGLLLGLFFISIGMRLDIAAILDAWALVVGAALGLVVLKAVILYVLARIFGATGGDALKIGAVLSQGGEFAFVVFSLGVASGLFTNQEVTLMSAIVTLSMMLTPFAMLAAERLAPQEASAGAGGLEGPTPERGHIIIAGFGRMGQIISQVLGPAGFKVTAIDSNPDHIRNAARFGFKVYYGDASRLDVLLTAGAEDARAVIFTMDDPAAVNHAVEATRARMPGALILAVAHDRMHEMALRPLGADLIVRETLESSLHIARETMLRLNLPDAQADDFIEQFRVRDRERLLAQMDYGPEAGFEALHADFELRAGDAR